MTHIGSPATARSRQGLADAVFVRPTLFLLVFTGLLLAINAPQQSFMAHDEGYYAQQARMMLASGDWITQSWWGSLVYDRAMTTQWIVAVLYCVFGEGELVARLPSFAACLGSVVLLHRIGLRLAPPSVALLGAAILATTPIFMQAAKLATQDVPLVFFELLAIWSLLKAEEGACQRRWFGALAGIAFGLAFAVKGFMALPAAAAMLPYLLWEHRRHRHLANPFLYLGALVGLAPTAAWLGASAALHGGIVFQHYFGKLLFLAEADFHRVGPFYYFWNVPANAFPWPLLALAGAVMVLRDPAYRRLTLLIGFPLFLFVELTVFTTRTWYYALQFMPMIALLAAACLRSVALAYQRGRERPARLMGGALALLGGLLLAAAVLTLVVPTLLPPELARVRWVALGAGLGLLAPAGILVRDRKRGTRSAQKWAAAWLAGPAAAIALLYATGLWGNYSAGFKSEMTAGVVGDAIRDTPVAFLFPDMEAAASEPAVLLALYTPHNGRLLTDPSDLRADELAWIPSQQMAQLPAHSVIGAVSEWILVRGAGGEEPPAAAAPGQR